MKKLLPIFIILVVTVFAANVGYYVAKRNGDINTRNVKPSPSFILSDNLSCSVQYSTDKDFKGKHISLIDLSSDSPKALFSGSGGTSPLKKIYESDDLLVVQLVAASGGLDTIHLNKETGIFTRTTSGSVAGEYAYAEKGACS